MNSRETVINPLYGDGRCSPREKCLLVKLPLSRACTRGAYIIHTSLEGIILTESVKSSVVDVEGFSVTDGFARGLHQHGKITADVVHDEEKNANSCRSHAQGHDFNEDSEDNAKPHFSWNFKAETLINIYSLLGTRSKMQLYSWIYTSVEAGIFYL